MSGWLVELEKVRAALELTGGSSAANTIARTIEEMERLYNAVDREREKAQAAEDDALVLRMKLKEADQLVAKYRAADLEPVVHRLEGEVERLKGIEERLNAEVKALRADTDIQTKKLTEANSEIETLHKAKHRVEMLNRWRGNAAKVLTLGLQKEMDPRDALTIAGYLTAGSAVPQTGISDQSYRTAVGALEEAGND